MTVTMASGGLESVMCLPETVAYSRLRMEALDDCSQIRDIFGVGTHNPPRRRTAAIVSVGTNALYCVQLFVIPLIITVYI